MIICITGIDCCGKGTQIRFLEEFLRKMGHDVFLSKAYGQTEKECFSLFLEYWHPTSIMFLFQALHTHQRVKTERMLRKNKIVIADRWDESYLIYHSNYGILKHKTNLRNHLNEIAFSNIFPDITFLLKIKIIAAKQRCKHRGEDFFDKLPAEYHETMQNGYLEMAKNRNWIIVNGEKSIKEIHEKIRDCLREKFPELNL